MTTTRRKDPPLTGTPLDYVPIDAPIRPVTPTAYRPPVWRRAIIAGLVAAAFLTPLLWL